MKILICGDVHWSQYSSILRKRGEVYSQRLEYLIKSINWVEKVGINRECDKIIYLGDFFDKPTLNDEEITALNEIDWANTSHAFIVGNHESSVNGLRYNSTKVLERNNFQIIDKPYSVIYNNTEISYIPYIIEDDRKSLTEYLPERLASKRIIFSHNDIKGISFGVVESKTGFELSDIESNCDLFINGHLHNGTWVSHKVRNLGNICGQNFGENAYVYKHKIMILDTNTLEYEDIENPYALNFLQLDIKTQKDIDDLDVKVDNAVISFKCNEDLINILKEKVDTLTKIVSYRILSVREEVGTSDVEDTSFGTDDYLQKFSQFILNKIGTSDTVKEEIVEVIK